MKSFLILLTSLFISLFLSGCYGSVSTKEGPTPSAVTHLTESKSLIVKDSRYGLSTISEYSKMTNKMMHGIRVVAEEGEKNGYRYFALTVPSFMNNIAGSPISNPDELFYLCGNGGMKEFLRHDTSSCDGLIENRSARYRAVYFKERPTDFLVWDIKETLANSHVEDADNSYEIENEDS